MKRSKNLPVIAKNACFSVFFTAFFALSFSVAANADTAEGAIFTLFNASCIDKAHDFSGVRTDAKTHEWEALEGEELAGYKPPSSDAFEGWKGVYNDTKFVMTLNKVNTPEMIVRVCSVMGLEVDDKVLNEYMKKHLSAREVKSEETAEQTIYTGLINSEYGVPVTVQIAKVKTPELPVMKIDAFIYQDIRQKSE